MTSIEWTEKTWNPIAGCSVVTPGCTNCYAMKQAWRYQNLPATPQYAGTVQKTRGGPVWTGKIGIASAKVLTAPLRRQKPTKYFVNSMSDLFHDGVPEDVIDEVFAVMALCPQHTFQILTKRPERMRDYLNQGTGNGKKGIQNRIAWAAVPQVLERAGIDWRHEDIAGKWRTRAILAGTEWVLPNVWLGVSVEDQTRADERIPHLLKTPAAIRFISAEPLLGAVDLNVIKKHDDGDVEITNYLTRDWSMQIHQGNYQCGKIRNGIDWVIVGGESGPNARPMHPDWARSLRDQCVAAGVPFFFKQWGAWVSEIDRDKDDADWRGNYSKVHKAGYAILNLEGGTGFHGDRVHLMKRTTKAKAGRQLDGRVWDEMPKVNT